MLTDNSPADIGSCGLAPEKWHDVHAWLCGIAIVKSDVFWSHEVPRNYLVYDFKSQTMRAMIINTLSVSTNQRLTNINIVLNYHSAFLHLTHVVAWFKQAVCVMR